MPDSRYIAKVRRRKTFWNNVTRVVIQLFVFVKQQDKVDRDCGVAEE